MGKPGRPVAAHTIATEAARKKIVEFVSKNLDKLLTAQLDLALGHWVTETDSDGIEKTYFKSPSNDAIKYLQDRLVGKPTEQLSVDNPNENSQLADINNKLDQMYKNVTASRK